MFSDYSMQFKGFYPLLQRKCIKIVEKFNAG